jgi:acetyltransferase
MSKNKSYKDLQYLLYPKSIAVIGATDQFPKPGARVIDNTIRVGFEGKIYPVNPKRQEVFGLKCYPSLSDIPGEIDSVWIALPNKMVLDTLEEAESKGVRVATVYSGGWSETGEEGKAREEELKAWLMNHNIRLQGPNTIGIGNTYSKVLSGFNSSMSFFHFKDSGDLGFVSQSGAMVGGIVGKAEEREIGLGYYIHTGNEADINMMDAIEFMIHDDKINVIMGYIEGIRDVDRFYRISDLAHSKGKAIIFCKTGRSEKGKKAVFMHTGTEAGNDLVYDGFFKQRGITRVYNHEELFETASLFSRFSKCNPVKEGGVFVFSPSGGAASMFADKAAEQDIVLPELSDRSKNAIRDILPPYNAPSNPFDVGGGILSDPSIAWKCLDIACRDESVEILVWIMVGPTTNPLTAKMIKDYIEVWNKHKKPIAVCTLASYLNEEGLKIFKTTHSPTFESTEVCMMAIKRYIDYHNFVKICPPDKCLNVTYPEPSECLEEVKAFLNPLKGFLSESQSRHLLSYYDIPVVNSGQAKSIGEAKKICKQIGYPVVLRVELNQSFNKTQEQVMTTDVGNESELEKEYYKLLENAKIKSPNAKIRSVLIEDMLKPGLDLAVRSFEDPQFGTVVALSFGGIFGEIMNSCSARIAPFNAHDALMMIDGVNGSKTVKNFKETMGADTDRLIDTLMKISRLSIELKENISQLNINPLRVYKTGKGVKALNALVEIK